MSIQYKNKFIPVLYQLEESFKNNNFEEVSNIFAIYAYKPGFNEALTEYLGEKKYFKLLFSPKHDELFLQRQCLILSHMSLYSAVKTIHYDFPTHIEHIKAIVNGNRYIAGGYNKTHDVLLNSRSIKTFINTCFVTENFDDIAQMQQLFGKKLLDNTDKDANICIEIKGRTETYTTNVYTSDIEYCPYHNIIYNYSEAKKEYLTSQGILLPTIDEATNLTHSIAIRFPNLVYLNEITSNLKHYNAYMLHNEMQESLPINKQTIKRAKI